MTLNATNSINIAPRIGSAVVGGVNLASIAANPPSSTSRVPTTARQSQLQPSGSLLAQRPASTAAANRNASPSTSNTSNSGASALRNTLPAIRSTTNPLAVPTSPLQRTGTITLPKPTPAPTLNINLPLVGNVNVGERAAAEARQRGLVPAEQPTNLVPSYTPPASRLGIGGVQVNPGAVLNGGTAASANIEGNVRLSPGTALSGSVPVRLTNTNGSFGVSAGTPTVSFTSRVGGTADRSTILQINSSLDRPLGSLEGSLRIPVGNNGNVNVGASAANGGSLTIGGAWRF